MIGVAAERLRRMGAGRDARIAVLAHADSPGVVLLLAAARVGAIVSPLNARWTTTERHRVLELIEPTFLLVGPGVEIPASSAVGKVVRAEDLVADGGADDRQAEPSEPVPSLADVDPRWILWTSGTMGSPRGILISHGAFRASAWAAAARLGLGADDRWQASLSPAHVGGLALILRAELLGSGLVGDGRFDPERFTAALDGGQITHASFVPIQLLRLLEHRGDRPFPDTFRTLLLGGDFVPRSLLDRALALGIPVALTWGMTETASQVATAPPELVRRKPGTVGAPLDGTEVRVDPETGEIHVRGPTLAEGEFQGLGRPLRLVADLEGWYRTGDLGHMDDEGHLWITGRLADRIVTGGVTVEPGEVEAILIDHPGVDDVAVVGVPDPEWGERIVAVVVSAPSTIPPTLIELLAFARTRLEPAKRPRELRVLRELPRTATGKVDRERLSTEVPGGEESA